MTESAAPTSAEQAPVPSTTDKPAALRDLPSLSTLLARRASPGTNNSNSNGSLKEWPPKRRPCAFCGQLIEPNGDTGPLPCDNCGLVQTAAVRNRFAEIAGEWFILDTPRPRSRGLHAAVLLKQIRAGIVRADSVISGPPTRGEWQYAGCVPGVAPLVGYCYACDRAVPPKSTSCANCGEVFGDLPDADAAIGNDESRFELPPTRSLGIGSTETGSTDTGSTETGSTESPPKPIRYWRHRQAAAEPTPGAATAQSESATLDPLRPASAVLEPAKSESAALEPLRLESGVLDPLRPESAARTPESSVPGSEIAPLNGRCPCASCGYILPAMANRCTFCGRAATAAERERARTQSGPWYVLDQPDRNSRGVSRDYLIRRAEQVGLKADSVIKSPTTHGEWRFAARTPELSRLFGVCHQCGESLGDVPTEPDVTCPKCGTACLGLRTLSVATASAPPNREHTQTQPIAPTVDRPTKRTATDAPSTILEGFSADWAVQQFAGFAGMDFPTSLLHSEAVTVPNLTPVVAGQPVTASPVSAVPVPDGRPTIVAAVPVMASPVMAAPVMAAPVMASPVMAAPVMAAPVMAAPVMAAPVMATAVPASPARVSVKSLPISAMSTAPVPSGESLLPPLEVMSGAAATVPNTTPVARPPSGAATPLPRAPSVATSPLPAAPAVAVATPVPVRASVVAAAASPTSAAPTPVSAAPVVAAAPAVVAAPPPPAPASTVAPPEPTATEKPHSASSAEPSADNLKALSHQSNRSTLSGPVATGARSEGGMPVPLVLVGLAASFAVALGIGYVVGSGNQKPAETAPMKTGTDTSVASSTGSGGRGSTGKTGTGSAAPFSDYNDDGTLKDTGESRIKARNEFKGRLQDAEAMIQSGQYHDAVKAFGEAALDRALDYPGAPRPEAVRENFNKALRLLEQYERREGARSSRSGKTDPSSKSDPPTKMEPTTKSEPPSTGNSPTQADLDRATTLVRKGDEAASRRDHHGAVAAYVEAAGIHHSIVDRRLRDKLEASLSKLANLAIKVDPNDNADKRKADAERLRKLAEIQEDTQSLEVVCRTYTELIATGYYTSADLRRFQDVRSRYEKQKKTTIFD